MSLYKYFARQHLFGDVYFHPNQITNLKIITKHVAFLTVSVGKKTPSNKHFNIVQIFHSSVKKYIFFSEFPNFVVKSLIGPTEHHAKLSYINAGGKKLTHIILARNVIRMRRHGKPRPNTTFRNIIVAFMKMYQFHLT